MNVLEEPAVSVFILGEYAMQQNSIDIANEERG
jgi:hypothetical protein